MASLLSEKLSELNLSFSSDSSSNASSACNAYIGDICQICLHDVNEKEAGMY